MQKLSSQQRAWLLGLVLVVALVLLLILLSWGITNANIVASVISGAGLAVVIVIGGSLVLIPDNQQALATERTLQVASATFGHMRHSLTPEGCNAVCQLLLPETSAHTIAMTDAETVLALVGKNDKVAQPGAPNTAPTLEVLKSKRVETFVQMDATSQNFRRLLPGQETGGRDYGIIVPLIVRDEAIGTIKLYYSSGSAIDATQLAIARGFGELISNQLGAYELDRQAELTTRAELKALQAQINPHFLFNALNTMAALTRTNPARARELMREFALFYRRTLESSDSLIPLSEELEQTRRYLMIEKARFGEDRIIESEHLEDACDDVLIPAFLVQPIVENAVRHAMRDEGPLHIDIHAATDGDDILVSVADDGLGMDDEAAERLLDEGNRPQTATGEAAGTGIALRNVAERVNKTFGAGSGVEIVSRLGEGTCVTLRLSGAAAVMAGVRETNDAITSAS